MWADCVGERCPRKPCSAALIAADLARPIAPLPKSMTTHDDHMGWRDVYRPATKVVKLCLKLTVIDEVLIVSFKEL